MDIKDKVAIVTGAAAGIGQAYAYAVADNGAAAVVLADLDEAGLAQTAAGVEERGARAQTLRVDVTDTDQLESLFATTQQQFGGIDIVFNNAGIMCGDPQWPATALSRIRTVVSVNLLAVMYGTRIALDAMAEKGGVVINTASVAAFSPMPADPMYSATKAAVVNFTQACAPLAESNKVRVNAVLPGVTETAILVKSGDGETPAAWLAPMLDMVAKLEPADIANAAMALITDDSKVGQCVVINNAPAKGEPHSVDFIAGSADFHNYATGRG